MQRFITFTIAFVLAAAPLRADALRVSHRGPRSTTAAMHLRAAFRAAGLTDAAVHVRIRRAPRRWRVTVTVKRKGSTVLVRRLRLRRGRLTGAIARGIARTAAGRLASGVSKRRRVRRRRAARRHRRYHRRRRRRRRAARQVKVVAVPVQRQPAAAPAASDAADEPAAPAAPPAQSKDRENPLAARDLAATPASSPQRDTASALGFSTPDAPGAKAGARAAKRSRRARRRRRRRRRVADAGLGFSTPSESRSRRRRRRRADDDDDDDADIRVRRRARGSDERVVFNAAVGFGIGYRRFLWENGSDIAVDWASGAYTQIGAEIELYPLQFVNAPRLLQRLGLRFAYAHSAGLSTDLEDPQGGADAVEHGASVSAFWGGLVYRLPRFDNYHAPRINLRVGIGYDHMGIDDNDQVKGISLATFAAGGDFTIAINRWISIYGLAEYRGILAAKSDMLAAYHPKFSAFMGFVLGGGVTGKLIRGLGYRGVLNFQRLSGTLPLIGDPSQDIRGADQIITFVLSLSYEV